MNSEKKFSEYCMKQEESSVKVSHKDLINWVAKVWYADKLSPKIINKSFKVSEIILNSDDSEDEMLIGRN